MKSHKGQTNFWMIGFFVLLIGVAFYFGKNFSTFFPGTSQTVPTAAAGQPTSTPGLSPTEVVVPSVTVTQKSALEEIRAAFAEKYNKPISQVDATINKNDSTHAVGNVKFSGEISGAWFLAYKNPTGWIIVQDGNGTISCETVAPYNFPVTMVPECVDMNGQLIRK